MAHVTQLVLRRRASSAALIMVAAVLAIGGCGSAEKNSPASTVVSATSTLVPSTTAEAIATTTTPLTQVQRVEYSEVGNLLPDLTTTTSSATHVIELQNRTLSVSVVGSTVCLGGGELGLQPDACADLTSGPGLLTYTDDADVGLYAVLTTINVSVAFVSASGVELSCYNEPISAIGPLVVSWCENEFAPVIRFEVANGPQLETTIG
jgi:hypothetical protein